MCLKNRKHRAAHQLFFDRMRRTVGSVFAFSRTNIVNILMLTTARNSSNHRASTIRAKNLSRKRIYGLRSRRASRIFPHQPLHQVELCFQNDWLMCIFRSCPLAFIFSNRFFDFVIGRSGLSLKQRSSINLIAQDSVNRACKPLGLHLRLEHSPLFGALLSCTQLGTTHRHH